MTTTTAMDNQDFIPPGMVELVINHMAGCGCDLETPDPEATLVQLGCVSGYLVERPSAPAAGRAEEATIERSDGRFIAGPIDYPAYRVQPFEVIE